MTRVAVILHERLGAWNRQLRPRLLQESLRWFESRSVGDLEGVLGGLAFPVVLIDLGRQPADGLHALDLVVSRAPGARTLVLDPDSLLDAPGPADELGATCVLRGFAAPPDVARLLGRWIALARRGNATDGWSRATAAEAASGPWGWLSDYPGELLMAPAPAAERPGAPR